VSHTTSTPGVTGAEAPRVVPNEQNDVSQRSVGSLISEVTTDLSTLMRQELDLAKAEM
jgi:hypothetical protein